MLDQPQDAAPAEAGRSVERLYREFGPALYRYALMILADSAAAADAVQRVFLGIMRVRTRGGPGARESTEADERYLRRAMRNECYSALRVRKREKAQMEESLLEAVSGWEERPEERLALEQALRQLPAEQREVVHLKVYEGLTFQEIADLSGESLNTIASRYRYALTKMRAMLNGHG